MRSKTEKIVGVLLSATEDNITNRCVVLVETTKRRFWRTSKVVREVRTDFTYSYAGATVAKDAHALIGHKVHMVCEEHVTIRGKAVLVLMSVAACV